MGQPNFKRLAELGQLPKEMQVVASLEAVNKEKKEAKKPKGKVVPKGKGKAKAKAKTKKKDEFVDPLLAK